MNDEETSNSDESQDVTSYRAMLERGVLDPQHREIADRIFGQENFTLLVLHAHLLIEKALNKYLAEHGVPEVLLGSEGLEFHQKQKAFMELKGWSPKGQNLFTVLNTLRNNVAHDFWNEQECVKDAFSRFLTGKKNRDILEKTAATPHDSVKLLYLLLAGYAGILVASAGANGGA